MAALTALGDEAWLEAVVERVAAARRRLYAIAQQSGLASVESAVINAIDCGRDGPFAVNVLKALERRGVFVRKPTAPGLDQHIRISVGPDPEMDVVAAELPQALRDAAAA